jgi:putative thiamine transport system permease protein
MFNIVSGNTRLRQFGWESAKFWLAVLPVLLIFGPLLPGLYWALAPALDASVWWALWLDTQWPQALRATLISSVLSTVLACGIAALLWPRCIIQGRVWAACCSAVCRCLLSVPHAAFAIGLFFLIAPSGWLARAVAYFVQWTSPPDWGTVQDPYGLSAGLGAGHQGKLVFVVGAGRGVG